MDQEKIESAFYESIGKLFYASIKCDNLISSAELEKLKKLLKNNVVIPAETNLLSSDTAMDIIHHTISDLIMANTNPNQCFNEFSGFYKNHYKLFTPEIKSKLWASVNSISSANHQKNKNELVFLSQLKFILQQH